MVRQIKREKRAHVPGSPFFALKFVLSALAALQETDSCHPTTDKQQRGWLRGCCDRQIDLGTHRSCAARVFVSVTVVGIEIGVVRVAVRCAKAEAAATC